MAKLILLFGLVCALSLFAVSEGCTCLPTSPQNKVCNSNNGHVVLRIKILAEISPPGAFNKYYIVHIQHIYKDLSGNIFYFFFFSIVETGANSAACGVNLNVGWTYIVTGFVQPNGFINVNSCGYISVWNFGTDAQVQNWLNNCNCLVLDCWNTKSCLSIKKQDDNCVLMMPDERSTKCLMTRSYCQYNPFRNKCSWNKDAGCKMPKITKEMILAEEKEEAKDGATEDDVKEVEEPFEEPKEEEDF